MMRLQRVGRRNDPTYRLVVTDKRTGPKSNKHVAILGSYNPKMNHVQIDTAAAKDWLQQGVQPSDTVHNILVGQNVIEAPKKNVLPKKSPIVDEEALAREAEEKAAAEAAAKAEAEAEAPTEEATETAAEAAEASSPAEETPAEADAEAAPAAEAASEAAEAETTEAEKKAA